jgi:large subunit ribosomal protein L19
MNLLEEVQKQAMKTKLPTFNVGDVVDVHVKIKEGDKERIQIFNGTVIARKGAGMGESFTVRRIVQGEGVERVFPIHSPAVVDVVVQRQGKVRRAKLYYLRDRVGKSARVAEKRRVKAVVPGEETIALAEAARAEAMKVRNAAKAEVERAREAVRAEAAKAREIRKAEAARARAAGKAEAERVKESKKD